MQEISHDEELVLQTVVGASALLQKSGNVQQIIESDGFDVSARMYTVIEGSEPVSMAKSTGLAVIETSSILDRLRPDVVVVVADRYEQIATAISASYMNIPVAHIQGGEITGSIDESVRHAITKLSHLHFPATELAASNLQQMGEDPNAIHTVGCPSIDLVVRTQGEISHTPAVGGSGAQLNLENPYIVVLQHPVTTEYMDSYAQVTSTLEAVSRFSLQRGIQVVWLWPNVDAGSDSISKKLREFRESGNAENFHFRRNFSPENYIRLIRKAKCLVGNSSSGIREASFLGVPSVNIGNRQSGRERANNVIDTKSDSEEILEALNFQVDHGPYPPSHLYGDGNAGKRIANLLRGHLPSLDKKFHHILRQG
jgi:UDP-hydrolysing UDP-N-acetyl-D-glucosamine 2-epimerase